MAVSEEIQEKVLAEATSATPNYDVDYNDERFGTVETQKNQALTLLLWQVPLFLPSWMRFLCLFISCLQTPCWVYKKCSPSGEHFSYSFL